MYGEAPPDGTGLAGIWFWDVCQKLCQKSAFALGGILAAPYLDKIFAT